MEDEKKDIRKLSLRIEEDLAQQVDKLAALERRSFNSEIMDLIEKGFKYIELVKVLIRDKTHVN
jgi:predicted HicB family RNase H-like nuclease